jgi:hypothetical protein
MRHKVDRSEIKGMIIKSTLFCSYSMNSSKSIELHFNVETGAHWFDVIHHKKSLGTFLMLDNAITIYNGLS